MKHIMKCTKCGNYSMKELCCGIKTVNSGPPKFSPEDVYGEYRRKAKLETYKKQGVI